MNGNTKIVALAIVIFGQFGAMVWWAASLSTKMDVQISTTSDIKITTDGIRDDLDDHMSSGAHPVAQVKMDAVEDDIKELQGFH